MSRFISCKLKLKVNEQKSAVARPKDRKFLRLSFTSGPDPKRRIAPKALARFKSRIRELTGRNRGVSLAQMVNQLSRYLQGWKAFFGFCQTPSVLRDLDSWIRRKLRFVAWKQWKRGRTRYAKLVALGVKPRNAAETAGSPHGPWRLSRTPAVHRALNNAYWTTLGLPQLEPVKA